MRFVRRVIAAATGDEPVASADGTCPHCGWTAARWRGTGFVGCPICYPALGVVVWDADMHGEGSP